MAEILNLGTNGNWRYKPTGGKLLAYYQDSEGDFEGVEMDFERSSPAYRTNEQGLLELMPVDIPRFDFSDGGNGVLLTEDSATNLIKFSNDPTESNWSRIEIDITMNDIVSPNGKTEGVKVADNTVSSTHRFFQTVTATTGIDSSTYIFVKKGTMSTFLTRINSSGFIVSLTFNLDTLSVSGTGTGEIIDAGNGWYKCISYFNPPTASTTIYYYLKTASAYVGDGSYMYFWEAQAVQQPVISSVIHTEGSTATRAADTGITTGDISHLINSEEGVLEVEMAALVDGGQQRKISVNDGTTANRLSITYSTNSGQIDFYLQASSGFTYSFSVPALNQTINRVYTFKYKSGDIAVKIDDVEVDSNTGVFSFGSDLKTLELSRVSDTENFYGNIKRISIHDSINDY